MFEKINVYVAENDMNGFMNMAESNEWDIVKIKKMSKLSVAINGLDKNSVWYNVTVYGYSESFAAC